MIQGGPRQRPFFELMSLTPRSLGSNFLGSYQYSSGVRPLKLRF